MSSLAVGDVLEDRYRIDHPIARGGMSVVYRCIDLRLGRAVAAKVMDERFADDANFRLRFRAEARAMGQLSHPNLVDVYDFSSSHDHTFLIMELITGGTLRELLAERGPMPPHAATAVMRAVLTGLSHAHQKGMVHRDIKPDNILIDASGTVKVTDFGLVRVVANSPQTTNEIVGTAAYLSPEQVNGSPITPASDVYSAGIVLFELLTGTTPFSGETPLAHAYSRLENDVPAPSSRIDGIPSLFDELVASATARSAEQRFTDAGEFLEALDDIAAELNLPAFTVPIPTNSAAHRAAAVPTDMTGIVETTHLPRAASQQPEAETKVVSQEPVVEDHTALMPAEGPVPAGPPVESEPVPEQRVIHKTAEKPEPMSNRSPAKTILSILVIIGLVGSVLLGGWWFGSGRYGEVPQIIGMNRTEAINLLSEAGFEPATDIIYHDEIPPDHIAETQPAVGAKILPGDPITLMISQGRPTVPNITEGISIEDYRAVADERTLNTTTGESVYSNNVPTGAVAEVSPAPGTAVNIGSTVTVHVSKGPEPITIPDLNGVALDQAREQLEELGLVVGDISHTFDPNVPGDHVISTNPGQGATVQHGDNIDIRVSTALEVPDVSGLSADEAEQLLEDAGFDVNTQRDSSATGSNSDEVIRTSPEIGSLHDPEETTEVTLILPGTMITPNLSGKTISEARSLARDAGLRLSTPLGSRGSDVITSQSPAAGEEVSHRSRVRVETD